MAKTTPRTSVKKKLAVAGAASAAAYFGKWLMETFWPTAWASIVKIFHGFVSWVCAPVSVSMWMILLGALILLLAVAIVIRNLATAFLSRPLQFTEYTEDHFYGANWSWFFGSLDRGIYGITATCPACHMQLEYTGGYHGHSALGCMKCRKPVADIPSGTYELEEFIRLEIQRKIRSGEWVEEVRKLREKRKLRQIA